MVLSHNVASTGNQASLSAWDFSPREQSRIRFSSAAELRVSTLVQGSDEPGRQIEPFGDMYIEVSHHGGVEHDTSPMLLSQVFK